MDDIHEVLTFGDGTPVAQTLANEQGQLHTTLEEMAKQVSEGNKKLTQTTHPLQQQQSRWQALFDHALEAILIADDMGRYLDANPAACKLLGMKRENLLEHTIADFADPNIDMAEVWQQFLEQGQMSGEFRLYLPDGQVRDTDFNAVANYVPGQHLSIMRDISEQKQLEAEHQRAEVALGQSEAQVSRILDNVGAAIGELSAYPDHTYVHGLMSVGCEAVYGYSQAEMTGDTELWQSRVVPEDMAAVIIPAYEQIFAGKSFSIEYRFRDKTDTIRWIAETLTSQWDAAADCWQITTVAIDITDRKQAEITLRESEARQTFLLNFSDALRQLSDPIAIQQNAMELVANYLGVTRALYFVVDADQNGVRKAAGFEADPVRLPDRLCLSDFGTDLAAAYRDGKTVVVRDANAELQLESQREAHREINVRAWVAVPLVKNGQLVVILGVHQSTPRDWTSTEVQLLEDVADRTWAAVERARSEEQLRLFMAASSDVVYRMSGDWQYVRYLEGKDFLAHTKTPCLYRLETYIPPEEQAQVWAAIQEAIRTKSVFELEHQVIRQDGTIGWTFSRAVPLLNEQGDIVEWFGAASDVTERKQAELALQQSEAKNRAILAALPDLILRIGADGVYREVFSSNCSFDVLAIQAVGLPMDAILPDDMAEQAYFYLQRALETGELQIFEQEVHLGDHLQYEEVRVIKSGDDEVLFIIRDISTLKQAELTLQRQIRQEQLLADIAQEIRQSLELNEVLSRTVERVRTMLDADRVVIFRFRPDWNGNMIMESVKDGWISIDSITIEDPCFAARLIDLYRQGHVSVLNDTLQSDLEPCYVELLRQFQVQASLAVPILRGDDLWGLLIAHQCDAPRQWQTNEIEMLQRLATQVGIASQQSELYEQTRNELAARQQIQVVLEESEARFRSLSAAAPIGICQSNVDGTCLYVNPRWVEISGLSFEECLGDGWLQSVHPDDRAMLAIAWASYLQEGGSDCLPEFRLLTPEGKIRWISARVATIKSAAGDVIGYVCTDEDITERKQAEQALRDSEQRLQAILDHAPIAIYIVDLQNRHLLINHSYAADLCTTPDNIVGKSLYDIWPPEVADRFAAQNRHILETGQLLQVEEAVPLSDGLHSYITVKFPLYDTAGNLYATCGISTDITERKTLETQFYQAQRLESLGTLAGGIAHDLNNILAPILTSAQLLRLNQKGLDAKGQELVNLLENSAKRGTGLVKQILAVTRTSQGKHTAVDLAALMQDELEIILHSLPKSIEIQTDIPCSEATQPTPSMIWADPTYLHQIILNLCVNARDAMAEGGTLTLSVTQVFVDEAMAARNLEAQVGNYAVITVADTGTGIPPEVKERMFDPFFTTKAPGQGTGLGLATVRGLVKANQGFIQVFSEVGQGTQFKVYFPLMEGATAEPEPSQPTSDLSPGHQAAFVAVEEGELYMEVQRDERPRH